MNIIEQFTDKELWALPYESLMQILEQDAMELIAGMTRDELDLIFDEAMEQRKKNCDIKKIAEQTDEENHECIRLNVLQNVVIDKSREIMFEEDYPDLYQRMQGRNISFKDIEKVLSAPKIINGELVSHTPTFKEVIDSMYCMLADEENRKCA